MIWSYPAVSCPCYQVRSSRYRLNHHYPRTNFLILGWVLGRRMVIRHSDLDYVRWDAECNVGAHVARLVSPPPSGTIIDRWCAKPTIFPNYEWGEGWHKMNEWMRIWNDMKRGDWKIEIVGWMKLGKQENSVKIPKNPDIAQ